MRSHAFLYPFTLSLGLVLVGCGEPAPGDPPSSETTDAGTTFADATTTTGVDPDSTTEAVDSTGPEPEPPTDSSESSSGGEPPPNNGECDVWAQDCAEGEKCVPWADDGGNSWNATRCVPLMGNGEPGDTCMLFGGEITGLDDCALGSICMRLDDGTDNGVCVPQCMGTPEEPSCAADDRLCVISNEGVMTVCLEECDPTLPSCPSGLGCYPFGAAGEFVCWPDFSGELGTYGDECYWGNSCDPGLLCVGAAYVPDCASDYCCSEICDVNAPDPDAACMGQAAGQMCTPFYSPGEEPPGLEHVGLCLLPM